jgi:glutathione S-transferase
MLVVYGIRPAFGLQCVSPFVTKVALYCRLAGVPFRVVPQNPLTVSRDSPTGLLPYADFTDGRRLADSNAILERLEREPTALDTRLDPAQKALSIAFTRLTDEHLYWTAIVAPRWASQAAWTRYRDALFGTELDAATLGFAESIRAHQLARLNGAGVGRCTDDDLVSRSRQDLEAIATLVEVDEFIFGASPSRLDATVGAFLAHIVRSPFDSPARDAALGSSAVLGYLDRLAPWLS